MKANKRLLGAVCAAAFLGLSAAAAGQEMGGTKTAPPWGWDDVAGKVEKAIPLVQVALGEAEAAQAAVGGAGLWANPELGLEAVGMGGTLPWHQPEELTVTLSQQIPIGGRATRQKAAAQAVAAKTAAEVEDVLAGLRLKVFARFVEALAATHKELLEQQRLELALRAADLLEARIKAGDLPEAERSRMAAGVALARLGVGEAAGQTRVALRKLAATWGGKLNEVPAVTGDLAALPIPESLVQLAGLYQQAPGWRSVSAEEEVWATEVAAAEAAGVPDLGVQVGGGFFGGLQDVGLVIGLEWALPLFDQNQAAVDEGRSRQRQARSKLAAWQNEWLEALGEAHGAYEVNYQRQQILANQVIPALEAALQAVETGFANGKLTTLDLLDSQTTLLDARVDLLEARRAAWDAVLVVEYLTGRLGQRAPGGAR